MYCRAVIDTNSTYNYCHIFFSWRTVSRLSCGHSYVLFGVSAKQLLPGCPSWSKSAAALPSTRLHSWFATTIHGTSRAHLWNSIVWMHQSCWSFSTRTQCGQVKERSWWRDPGRRHLGWLVLFTHHFFFSGGVGLVIRSFWCCCVRNYVVCWNSDAVRMEGLRIDEVRTRTNKTFTVYRILPVPTTMCVVRPCLAWCMMTILHPFVLHPRSSRLLTTYARDVNEF